DQAIAAFQSAAEKRFGVKNSAKFKPFLRRLRVLKILLADPQPLTLAELMDGPLAHILAPNVSISGEDGTAVVRLRSSWLPRDGNQLSAWYASLATALEFHNATARVRLTAAKMVGFELKDSTLSDCGWITLVVACCVGVSLAAALRSLTS